MQQRKSSKTPRRHLGQPLRLQIILFIFHPTNNRAPERGQQRFRVLGSNKSIWEEGLNS